MAFNRNQMRKGGNNFINQPTQPLQQQGFIGTAINDINNNKDILNPIYDTTATIGYIYNIGATIIICIIFGIIIAAGVYIINIDSDKTKNVSGFVDFMYQIAVDPLTYTGVGPILKGTKAIGKGIAGVPEAVGGVAAGRQVPASGMGR